MGNVPESLSFIAIERAYRSGTIDPCGLVDAVFRRVRTSAPEAWISLATEATVRNRATVLAGLLRERGEVVFTDWPLFGIPFAVKDNIDVAGLTTTVGCPEFAYTPAEAAPAVNRLLAAGAILIGKTNLDQFATGLTGTRSPYGAVPNPFNPRYISGGSSSGSAVAVAAGCVAFSLGTDTAGSGRIPAAFCNLVGIKPTPGLVSTRGVFPACRSMDCVSIFANTVTDGWRALQILSGPDPFDPYSRRIEPLAPRVRGMRVGVPNRLNFRGDGRAEAAFAATRDAIAGAPGVRLSEVDFAPFAEAAALLYEGPWVAERRLALGDFFLTQGAALEPSVRSVIAKGDLLSACDAFHGAHRLQACRMQAAEIFGAVDLVLVPTAPTHYTHEEIAAAPIERNSVLGSYTNFVNLLGLSALALPGRFREDGLPFGITLIAPGGGDHRLAEFARTLEPLIHLRLGVSRQTPPRNEAPLPPLPYVEPTVKVAVAGAHLTGQPLNWQLIEAGGRLVRRARTAPHYLLYALPGATPPKPGLVRTEGEGGSLEIEVWELPMRAYGRFVAEIPPPLGIGTLELEDGEHVQGFLCESWALAGARDITSFGGWRPFLAEAAPEAG